MKRPHLVYVLFFSLSMAVTVVVFHVCFFFIAFLIHAMSSLKSPNSLHKLCASVVWRQCSDASKHKEVIVKEWMCKKGENSCKKKGHIFLWLQLKTAILSTRFELQSNRNEPDFCANLMPVSFSSFPIHSDQTVQSIAWITLDCDQRDWMSAVNFYKRTKDMNNEMPKI